VFSVTFVLWLLTYLNFRRGPGEWTKEVPNLEPKLYGIPIVSDLLPARGFIGWLDFAYLALGFAMVLLLVMHLRRPLPFMPTNWLGKGQLFYLVFLWSIVTMNFVHVLPRFTPIRLVTEWFMTLNAVACTILLVHGSFARSAPVLADDGPYLPLIRKTVIFGLLGAAAVSFVGLGVKLACWGDKPAGVVNNDQIRFGPKNTNTIR